jgi:hypothetical protein
MRSTRTAASGKLVPLVILRPPLVQGPTLPARRSGAPGAHGILRRPAGYSEDRSSSLARRKHDQSQPETLDSLHDGHKPARIHRLYDAAIGVQWISAKNIRRPESEPRESRQSGGDRRCECGREGREPGPAAPVIPAGTHPGFPMARLAKRKGRGIAARSRLTGTESALESIRMWGAALLQSCQKLFAVGEADHTPADPVALGDVLHQPEVGVNGETRASPGYILNISQERPDYKRNMRESPKESACTTDRRQFSRCRVQRSRRRQTARPPASARSRPRSRPAGTRLRTPAPARRVQVAGLPYRRHAAQARPPALVISAILEI